MKIIASKYENHGSIDEMLSAFKSVLNPNYNIETTTEVYADDADLYGLNDEYLDALIDRLDSAHDFNYNTTFRKTLYELTIYITDYDDDITEFAVPYSDLSFDDIEEDARYIIDEINNLMEE